MIRDENFCILIGNIFMGKEMVLNLMIINFFVFDVIVVVCGG